MQTGEFQSLRLAGLTAALSIFLAATGAAHPPAEECETIAQLMHLQPGMTVADVGAGDGEWGEALAHKLETSGHVYLTEIDDGELIKLRQRLQDSELENMSVVVGSKDATGLPDACCDAMLLRLVYHHMSDRAAMRASLKQSLRADALLVVIELDQNGHGIEAQRLVDEMTADGFQVVSRHPDWGGHGDHYAVVFRR
jgi:ubiquinone/menaquinone biosynthesis C-methylase UbiE